MKNFNFAAKITVSQYIKPAFYTNTNCYYMYCKKEYS